ncbi:MAG: polysaccharide deacetylase [Bacteroidetes bacterium]|nr:MAG: polysaccharide deacetylase [Bacteroidota bacterium]RLD51732.1 MAG: polysaccharide deacetylase [Bacteroidota bacterium]RLD79872.1 MAG: polysaccharide deacetylase [Bacteroidota bacterium]
MSEKYCILSNDVETTSIVNNCLSDDTGQIVLREGMPMLLDLYAEYGVKTTFFFTAHIAKLYPEIVKMIIPYGHEVASHGYTHEIDQAFDVLSLEQQIEHLKNSKEILEDISGKKLISFRAPAARVNRDTPLALKETGFKIDSSVASQRFDMFLSLGSMKKLNWLIAPRKPYFTKQDNLWKRGDGEIFEIPISALLMPYIGTTLRIFPFLSRQLRRTLARESSMNKKPIVFLTHPNEFIDEVGQENGPERRSSNYIAYLFSDLIRHHLKLKNLGKKALPLYQEEIRYFKSKDFKFVSCSDYYSEFTKNK